MLVSDKATCEFYNHTSIKSDRDRVPAGARVYPLSFMEQIPPSSNPLPPSLSLSLPLFPLSLPSSPSSILYPFLPFSFSPLSFPFPFPQIEIGGLGSAVSRAPAEIEFGAF